MLMTTQNRFEDHEITETLGVVKGSTIRSRHIGKDITAWLRRQKVRALMGSFACDLPPRQ